MNTNKTALDTYTEELALVHASRVEFEKIPLSKIRQTLAGPTQRLATIEQVEDHCASTFGASAQTAGMKFLESIHDEIRANEPQWKKDMREQEEELERISNEKAACAEVAALTSEE